MTEEFKSIIDGAEKEPVGQEFADLAVKTYRETQLELEAKRPSDS